MPKVPLTAFTLSDLAKTFSSDDKFYFSRLEDSMHHWQCNKGSFTYIIFFYVNEFSELESPCDIHTIIAAIDESRHFGLSMKFD